MKFGGITQEGIVPYSINTFPTHQQKKQHRSIKTCMETENRQKTLPSTLHGNFSENTGPTTTSKECNLSLH